ncbi:hypothetical protein ACLMJK_001695 [Lecanora helva]
MVSPMRLLGIIPLVTILHLIGSSWAVPWEQDSAHQDQTQAKTLEGSQLTGSNLTAPLPARIVYDFPQGTWIENIAVRQNGQLVVTEITKPRVYQVDPSGSGKPVLIHEFQGEKSILGITEGAKDVFYVASGDFILKGFQILGPGSIYKVDLRQFSPNKKDSAKISKVTTVKQSKFLNGVAFLGGKSNLLLAADSAAGIIYSVNVDNGDTQVAINNSLLQPFGPTGTGVNGIKLYNNFLYFANTGQQTVVKVPINGKGEASGDFTTLSKGGILQPDDFALDAQGDVYAATGLTNQEGLAFVPREGGPAIRIAGAAGPTGAAFGRTKEDRDVVYLTTSGGGNAYQADGPVTVSGKVLKINVDRIGYSR